MTEKVFWEDPYLTRLATTVAAVEGNEVVVERTIFFAFSGGQESDQGSVAGRPVLRARKLGREIRYELGDGHGLKPGDAVEMAIDWPRRYRLMRLHFAAELVLEVATELLGPIEKIGAHIAADKARIDFRLDDNISRFLPEIAARARHIVEADLAIVSAFSDRQSERRYWQVEGLARVPCGGTHLRRTGEVGALDLRRKNLGKGKERIEVYLGEGPAPPPS